MEPLTRIERRRIALWVVFIALLIAIVASVGLLLAKSIDQTAALVTLTGVTSTGETMETILVPVSMLQDMATDNVATFENGVTSIPHLTYESDGYRLHFTGPRLFGKTECESFAQRKFEPVLILAKWDRSTLIYTCYGTSEMGFNVTRYMSRYLITHSFDTRNLIR